MKKRIFKYLQLLGCISLISLVSCNDDSYETLENGVYFKEALKTDFQKVAIKDEAVAELTVKVGQVLSEDSKYKFAFAPESLAAYNKVNGTAYQSVAPTQVEFPKSILIKEGEAQSEKTQIKIKEFTEEMIESGASYAIPLKIESVDGKALPVGKTSTFIIGLERIFKTKAVIVRAMDGAPPETGEVFRFNIGEEEKAFSNITMEFWMAIEKVGGAICGNAHPAHRIFIFKNNRPSANCWHVWNNGDYPAANSFSFYARNTELFPSTKIVPSGWAHYAMVFDGGAGVIKLYINGVEEASASIGSTPFTFNSDAWGFNRSFGSNDFAFREFRFWSVARTTNQIKNNMEIIDPTTPGLEFYTKFDSDEEGVFKDLSGHEGYQFEYSMTKWKDEKHVFTRLDTPIEYIDYTVGDKTANLN
ncbi:MAG: DUF1735 and LamG domain-containing protein [Carboxylicivirga sp.]|jgi:hypothetical protein|nr:DUF1735 and LamG domain-containing protein [Carboxylicivirga sp.]